MPSDFPHIAALRARKGCLFIYFIKSYRVTGILVENFKKICGINYGKC